MKKKCVRMAASALSRILPLLLAIYIIGVLICIPLSNWQFLRANGISAWFLDGGESTTYRAFGWPVSLCAAIVWNTIGHRGTGSTSVDASTAAYVRAVIPISDELSRLTHKKAPDYLKRLETDPDYVIPKMLLEIASVKRGAEECRERLLQLKPPAKYAEFHSLMIELATDTVRDSSLMSDLFVRRDFNGINAQASRMNAEGVEWHKRADLAAKQLYARTD